MRMLRLLPAAALTAAIAVPLCCGAAGAQTKITVGKIVGGIGLHIPSYIAMDKGFFKEEGLDARWIELQGRPMITAGLTGNLDFVPIPSGGANARRPFAIISASRWHPVQVVIWTTAQPAARMRSASRCVA